VAKAKDLAKKPIVHDEAQRVAPAITT
jgi:hypothetical protein